MLVGGAVRAPPAAGHCGIWMKLSDLIGRQRRGQETAICEASLDSIILFEQPGRLTKGPPVPGRLTKHRRDQ